MALPNTSYSEYDDELEAITAVEDDQVYQPSLTWHLDRETHRIRGQIDGLDTLEQAVWMVLSTELGRYMIYDDTFGVELEDLVGMDLDYARVESEARIREAILQDERFEEVDNFEYEKADRNSWKVSFDVHTSTGFVIQYEGVTVNV